MPELKTQIYQSTAGVTTQLYLETTADQVQCPDAEGQASTVQSQVASIWTRLNTDLETAIILQGSVDGTHPLPVTGYEVGWAYYVAEDGPYSNTTCREGDLVVCVLAEAETGDHWAAFEAARTNAVNGPASSVAGNLPTFATPEGNELSDSGITASSLATNTDLDRKLDKEPTAAVGNIATWAADGVLADSNISASSVMLYPEVAGNTGQALISDGAGSYAWQSIGIDDWNTSANVTTPQQGAGTELDPYLVYTCGDLVAIPVNSTAHYKMMANLDFTDLTGISIAYDPTTGAATKTVIDANAPYYNTGNGIQTNSLDGVLDGDGHKIKGWAQYCSGTNPLYGLFPYLGYVANGAQVKNLEISGTILVLGGNGSYMGSVCGQCSKDAKISNVHSNMMLLFQPTSTSDYAHVGGIVGTYRALSGSITDCTYTGTIATCKNSGTAVSSSSYLGGICAGVTNNPTIIRCTFEGVVYSPNAGVSVAGIYGGTATTPVIDHCYMVGRLEGATRYPISATGTVTGSAIAAPFGAGAFLSVPAGGTSGQILSWGASGPEWTTPTP